MAKGHGIILAGEPRGKFLEGTIVGTPKPGTVMQIKAGVAPVSGRHSWEASTKATGAKQLIAVLLPDDGQGADETTAYVTGKRGRLYCPVAGEELNMRVADVSGTADDVAIGDLFGVETVTGKLKANSSYASTPFTAMEAVTDPTADYLLWVTFNGH